jgi:enoyl-CoA hydratase
MLHISSHEGAVTLTLNQPAKANALSEELVERLIEQVVAALGDDSIHTLIFCGEGKHFCSGLDLSDLASSSDAQMLYRLVRIETLLDLVWRAPIRTIALVQGRTWGAGADLMVACEQKIAAPGTTFRFPGAQFGIVLGTRRLALRVGRDASRRLILDAQEWSVEQALKAGLIDDVGVASGAQGSAIVGRQIASLIRQATHDDSSNDDLGALVRSAAEPGLVNRMTTYLNRLRTSASKSKPG